MIQRSGNLNRQAESSIPAHQTAQFGTAVGTGVLRSRLIDSRSIENLIKERCVTCPRMGLNEVILNAVWLEPATSIVIDFTLAFLFFTSLCFAVLGKRFDHQRSAAAMSAALGASLALGLVAWEVQTGWRILSLGPIAAGLGMIVLALVIHQAIRRVGGDWAGAAIGLGAAALIGVVLDLPWPLEDSAVGAAASLALIVGAGMWWLRHGPGRVTRDSGRLPTDRPRAYSAARAAQQQVHEVNDVHRLERQIDRSLQDIGRAAKASDATPDKIVEIRRKLAELIPQEGLVTRRLADLRARAVLAEKGHLARLRKLSVQIPKMTPLQARLGAKEVREAYRAAGFYRRIERLDAAAAEAERRVQRLSAQAEAYAEIGQLDSLQKTLQDAQKLQHQARRLVEQIERDENKLLALVMAGLKQVMTQRGEAGLR